MSLISVKDITFGYEENLPVVKDLSLEIDEGKYIAIIGHNGSGKSTLAKLLNGLLKVEKGDVVVDGLSVLDKKNLFEIRKKVGVVFQNPDNQLIASIVEDEIAFGVENIGLDREEMGKRIDFALSAVGMSEFRKSTPSRLSGGQKQRIAIAGVLALMPKVLVLDESTAMLDPKGRKEVLDVVKRLNKERNMTVVAITHYMEETVFADEIIVLDKGKIAMKGSPKEVFANKAKIKELGLELPPVTALAEKIKSAGLDVREDVLTVEELEDELCKLKRKI